MKRSTCLLTFSMMLASANYGICSESDLNAGSDLEILGAPTALNPYSLIQLLTKKSSEFKDKEKKQTQSSGDSFLRIKGAGKLSDKPGLDVVQSPKNEPIQHCDQDLPLFQDPVDIHLYGKDDYTQLTSPKKPETDSNNTSHFSDEFQQNSFFESGNDYFCG